MSTTVQGESKPLWHGDDVTVADVLSALNEIRRNFAREETGDEEHVHPRNCVMTLIGVTPTESDELLARRTTLAIATQHPAQAIVIREEAPLGDRRLDGWITSEVRRPETACAWQCEIITLHVPGGAADHLAELVDPFLVSGLPTYLWWLGTPPFGKEELIDALRVCDGLVVDSAQFDEPYNSFRRMAGLLKVAHHRMGLADIQWARLRPWRETIAQIFTPLDRRAFLGGISEVGVEYAGERRGNRVAAALITGWIAAALGWKIKRAAAGTGGVVVAHYESGNKSVEVHFRPVKKDHLASGEINAVRIGGAAQGTTFRLTVEHDPARRPSPELSAYRILHTSGGQDEAGVELAERRAEQHREVLHDNVDSLHHTATGDPPGESRPRQPRVLTTDRRRTDSARVLLTMLEIGESATLRHVQTMEPEDDATLLLDLLSTGTHDEVYNRALGAAADLVDKF